MEVCVFPTSCCILDRDDAQFQRLGVGKVGKFARSGEPEVGLAFTVSVIREEESST